jgi:hypothetical protein
MSIQVGIPQSLTYKMKMLPFYSSLFSFLCVMHKISSLISDSCEAYIWLDYTSEKKSQRKEKHKHTHHIQGVPFPSVCLCGKAMIRKGEIYQLPSWKLIGDVYSCHQRTDVIVVTLHWIGSKNVVTYANNALSLKEVTARKKYLLNLLFRYFILFPYSQSESIYCGKK